MREFFIRCSWGMFEVWVKDPSTNSQYCLTTEPTLEGAINRACDHNGGPLTLSLTSGLV